MEQECSVAGRICRRGNSPFEPPHTYSRPRYVSDIFSGIALVDALSEDQITAKLKLENLAKNLNYAVCFVYFTENLNIAFS